MQREPNSRLVDLFALTGWSKGELARLVNRRAAGMGHPQLATDTSRVRRWLEDGERPRDPVPKVLATLFTERLGRVVTVEDLGLAGRQRQRAQALPEQLPWSPERTIAALTEFTGMDLMLNRRGFTGVGPALIDGPVLVTNFERWMHGRPGTPPEGDCPGECPPPYLPAEGGPVGPEEVEALEHAVTVFRAWDAGRGGGLQRKAVIGQLNEIGNLLTAVNPAVVTTRLWRVAADLAVLAGWMSHDIGLEPTAQNYFVIAAHAAREAGDLPRAAEALSRAARQMIHLDRAADALALVDLAQRTAGPGATATTRAMFRTVEAWALAALGREGECRRALGIAESLFARSRPAEDPDWISFFDAADLHGMQALVHRTLAATDPAAAATARHHACRALELRAEGDRRSRAFDLISLAAACFVEGRPDEGASFARQAVEASREMASRRTWDRLRDMRGLTDPYAGLARVRELRDDIATGFAASRG